jgi:hypothetical protein
MPPLQALAALHGAWLVLLVPPTVWVMHRWSARRLWLTGIALTTAGVLGLVAVVGRDLLSWLSWVAPEQQRYLGQRMLYAIVTTTDLPLVQFTVVGMVCWIAGKRRGATRDVPPANPHTHARFAGGSETSERSGDGLTVPPN